MSIVNKRELPFVSALLVTKNERDFIRLSLLSLINQTYPKSRYEIIVVDGYSDDGTIDVILDLQKKYSTKDFSIRLLKNEKQILSSGWNLGIKAANGDFVLRIDAHATAASDYIEKCVETMSRVDAVCVGGKLITKSLSDGNEAVPLVLSSPFGVGNAAGRVSNKEGYVDTAAFCMYRKDIFEKAGFFNEKMVRNQDIEMHGRIRKVGGRCYFNPDIKVTYYSRNTFRKMLTQAYENGKWNMVLLIKDHSALSLRHLIPFVFVLYLIVSLIGGLFWHPLWIVCLCVLCLHIILGFIFSIKKSSKLYVIIKMPFLFISLHIAYGLGYFKGITIAS